MSRNIQVKCIKDVVMSKSKEVAFIKGKTYDAHVTSDGWVYAKDEQGEEVHYINSFPSQNDNDRHKIDFAKSDFFNNHFVVCYETVSNSDIPEYVTSVLEQEKIKLLSQAKRIRGDILNHKEMLEDLEESLEDIMGKLDAIYKVTG